MSVSNRSAAAARHTRARLEDLAWLTETGETFTGAAARLGISTGALAVWTKRHAPHLATQLRAREHRHDNQWSAA